MIQVPAADDFAAIVERLKELRAERDAELARADEPPSDPPPTLPDYPVAF